MADETLTQEEREEVFVASLDDVGPGDDPDNYIGASPDSMFPAWETELPVADEDEDAPGAEVRERVKVHQAAMAQPQNEVKGFSDWVGERETGVGGPGSSRVTKSGPSPQDEPDDDDEPDEPTLTALRQRASELDIPGRSSMDRDELVEAIDAAGG